MWKSHIFGRSKADYDWHHLAQVFLLRQFFTTEECHPRDHQHSEGVAAGAPEESLPNQGRENNARYHHQDDPYTGGLSKKNLSETLFKRVLNFLWPSMTLSIRCLHGLPMHAGGWKRRTRWHGHHALVKALMIVVVKTTATRLRSHPKVTKIFLVSQVEDCVCTFCSFPGLLDSDWEFSDLGIIAEQQCTDLQSDLEDFDLLESDASDSEPKLQFIPEDNKANPNTDIRHGHLMHPSDPLHERERLSPDCSKLTSVQQQNNSYMNPDLQSTDSKLKIWSIAHTAVSLEASLQPEYPPCMLSSAGSSSPGYPTNMALTKANRQQESPVATLREWVDGVFHGPPFQQPKHSEAWKGLNDAMMDSRTPAQSFELVQSPSSL